MYQWYMSIVLRNGDRIHGYVENELSNSGDVIKKYFSGYETNFSSILVDKVTNVSFRLGDVSAYYISSENVKYQ